MINAIPFMDAPKNEPVRPYLPADRETASLKSRLAQMASETIDIPAIIGGKEILTGNVTELRCPHDLSKVIARIHHGTPDHPQMAIDAAMKAWNDWSRTDIHTRLSVFYKMASLLAGPWRDTLNASTMLGQSKTCHQAEIDAACELIDFYNFNSHFALTRIYSEQPQSPNGVWDYMDHRPLEGFVFAVTPFNFTSIAGNLPTAPALMGNVVLWKPATTQMLSAYYLYKLFEAAGLPPGVINLLTGGGAQIGQTVFASPDFAGVHFTGSTGTFNFMWKQIGENIGHYKTYPRIVGETGGKDFIFAHPSADVDALVANTVRGAFEYQGQKCSAASRMYVPRSIYGEFKEKLLAELRTVKMGDTSDFSNFMGAVIDEKSFASITGYINHAKENRGAEIIAGGGYDRSQGWFIQATVIECTDPKFKTMQEEIFGPVLSIHPYDDAKLDDALELCNTTSPYGLTGGIFAQDRYAIREMMQKLRFAAGNFYVNDKPTGAVVGQQPFGGARASGTNDKAGSPLNLMRWVSPRAIKETFAPARNYRYGFHTDSTG